MEVLVHYIEDVMRWGGDARQVITTCQIGNSRKTDDCISNCWLYGGACWIAQRERPYSSEQSLSNHF